MHYTIQNTYSYYMKYHEFYNPIYMKKKWKKIIKIYHYHLPLQTIEHYLKIKEKITTLSTITKILKYKLEIKEFFTTIFT